MFRQGEHKKVFVGLSGGVDSSVSAALLKKAGFNVTGVFIKVWQPDFFACTAKDDRLDAMRVCAKLSIPFRELNLEKEYKKEVVDYMIREYKLGRTPNPDVMCNRFIKFGAFYNWARGEGADFIATGHYARIAKRESYNAKRPSPSDATRYTLHAGLDSNKDQSYFLWQIKKEQLPHILFPVGGMEKTAVRSLAKKFGLITADKKDSQGLCFIGKVDMKDFLRHYIKDRPGKVYDERGVALGAHRGAFFYTIGERVGNLTLVRGSEQRPYYVVGKDTRRNRIMVSSRSRRAGSVGDVTEVKITNCNWLDTPQKGTTYAVRTRYRQTLERATVVVKGSKALVRFNTPQLIASGQSLVVYEGDRCVGGGIIM